jgi:DNA-directed RNA polymerase specialized sigma24 family protein
MAEQARTRISGIGENQYATREDFLKIFDEDLNRLYQLSFLLTGDHQKGERCFVAGIEDYANENRVFREWARAWTKRVIVENAIRELKPRRNHSNSSSLPSVFSHNQQSSSPTRHFDADAVLGLADFERFVFVLCVLERYRENECALLLGCSCSQVREACTRAIEALASIGQVFVSADSVRRLSDLTSDPVTRKDIRITPHRPRPAVRTVQDLRDEFIE